LKVVRLLHFAQHLRIRFVKEKSSATEVKTVPGLRSISHYTLHARKDVRFKHTQACKTDFLYSLSHSQPLSSTRFVFSLSLSLSLCITRTCVALAKSSTLVRSQCTVKATLLVLAHAAADRTTINELDLKAAIIKWHMSGHFRVPSTLTLYMTCFRIIAISTFTRVLLDTCQWIINVS
jgi:hypothetical protein